MNGRGWTRTSSLLRVKQVLFPIALPAREFRDKGSNLDLHVQSVASCRLDDPGVRGRLRGGRPPPCRDRATRGSGSPAGPRLSVHLPHGRSTQQARQRSDQVFHATRLPFDPGSPAAGCACPRRSPSYVEGLWSPSLDTSRKNDKLKPTLIASDVSSATHRGSFSLRRGLDSV